MTSTQPHKESSDPEKVGPRARAMAANYFWFRQMSDTLELRLPKSDGLIA